MIEFTASPNRSSRKGQSIEGVIIHYTAGGDIDGTIKWFADERSQVSAHYVISRSGRIVQTVREEEAAWHSGSRSTAPTLNGVTNLNLRTIGIELCNWGPIHKAVKDEAVFVKDDMQRYRYKDSYYVWPKGWTYKYRGPEPFYREVYTDVLRKGDKYWPGGQRVACWEPYTAEQLSALGTLLYEIVGRYPYITPKWVAGHSQVDPERKLDPGPAMDLPGVRKSVLGKPGSQDDILVIDDPEKSGLNADAVTISDFMGHYEDRATDFVSLPWWKRFCI